MAAVLKRIFGPLFGKLLRPLRVRWTKLDEESDTEESDLDESHVEVVVRQDSSETQSEVKVVFHRNGTKEVIYPDGIKVLIQPNGADEVTCPDGTKLSFQPDGFRELTNPDGSKLQMFVDGTMKIVTPKGLMALRYPYDSEVSFLSDSEITSIASKDENGVRNEDIWLNGNKISLYNDRVVRLMMIRISGGVKMRIHKNGTKELTNRKGWRLLFYSDGSYKLFNPNGSVIHKNLTAETTTTITSNDYRIIHARESIRVLRPDGVVGVIDADDRRLVVRLTSGKIFMQ